MRGLVLFDFGGTWDADGARWSIRFHSAYRAAGGRQSFAAFEKVFRESDRALGRFTGIERLGFRAMVDAQAGLLLARLPDGATLSKKAIADDFHASTCAVVSRNTAVLECLQQSYHLGVVSNFTGNLEQCLQELGVMKYFSVIADSGRVGVTKPDPRLFQHALTKAGLGGTTAWMVRQLRIGHPPFAALGLHCVVCARLEKSPERGWHGAAQTLFDLARVLGP